MTKLAFEPHKVKTLIPLHDNVIVSDMVFDQRMTGSGIILMNDDGKNHGIRPRWAKVYAVGPEQKDLMVGQWVLVDHGRWTRGIKIEDETGPKTIRRIDCNDILMVSDTPMNDEILSDKGI